MKCMCDIFYFIYVFSLLYVHVICYFFTVHMFTRGLRHFGAWSAFHLGMFSSTCSYFKCSLCFLPIVYDVQTKASYCGSSAVIWPESEKLESLKWVCHHSKSHIVMSLTWEMRSSPHLVHRAFSILMLFQAVFLIKKLKKTQPLNIRLIFIVQRL